MILAATGHRPDKLGGYGPEVGERLFQLACATLRHAKPSQVISGMAMGWDTAWAEAAVACAIPFIAAVPFDGQDGRWGQDARGRYGRLLQQAQEIVVISPGDFAVWKMHKRNEWMVDRCDKLIALWNGSSGGTHNCVQYAQRKNKKFVNLWPVWSAL